MHPLGLAIQAACDGGLDFYLIVAGSPQQRREMGLPSSVAHAKPLLLQFLAAYFPYSQPTPKEDGVSCILSFDTLYSCHIPYASIQRFIIENPEADTWTRTGEETAEQPDPPPDNVRPFRPRRTKRNA